MSYQTKYIKWKSQVMIKIAKQYASLNWPPHKKFISICEESHLSLLMFSSMFSIEPCWRISFKAVSPPIPVALRYIIKEGLWREKHKICIHIHISKNIFTGATRLAYISICMLLKYRLQHTANTLTIVTSRENT